MEMWMNFLRVPAAVMLAMLAGSRSAHAFYVWDFIVDLSWLIFVVIPAESILLGIPFPCFPTVDGKTPQSLDQVTLFSMHLVLVNQRDMAVSLQLPTYYIGNRPTGAVYYL